MILKGDQTLVFLGVEDKQSKKTGNPFQLVKLGDPTNFENFEFFKRDDLNLSGINKGDSVKVAIELSKNGYNVNTDLVRVDPAK